MSLPIQYHITELNRRLSNLIHLGVIIGVDLTGVLPRAQVRIGELQTAWLPIIMPRAGENQHFVCPEINEQVMVLSPSGDLAQGIILGSLNQVKYPLSGDSVDIHRLTYQDGATIEYDRKKHHQNKILAFDASWHEHQRQN